MSSHPLTNFEIQRYYQNEPTSSGVYSRNSIPVLKTPTTGIKDIQDIRNKSC